MDKATKLYQEFIDELAEKSKSCVDANNIKKGIVPGIDTEEINAVLKKLTEEERNVLAKFVTETYSSGIFDVLDLMEWYACCKDMKITIDGEVLPTDKFEGFQNDYIGRREDWEWPKEC